MPPARLRTSNPQGRQKSCSECAKAKRRCDLQQPSCLRCSRQNLACTYPPQPHASAPSATPALVASTSAVGDDIGDFDMPLSLDIDAPCITETELLDFNFVSAMNPVAPSDNLQDPGVGELVEIPSPLSNLPFAKTLSTIMMSSMVQSRIGYSMAQLNRIPRMMVEANATPWCHPKLYEDYMPRCLQDACAACALYISRNETNATLVARYIIDRTQELVDQHIATPPIEILAQAQALLLYQIMLVYSGDIRCYSQEENIDPHMNDIRASLYAISFQDDPIGPLPFYPITAARSAWRSFIFRESCRRTLLIMHHASVICNILRGRFVACNRQLSQGNRVTMGAKLWSAEGPFEFAKAWNEENHFLVKDLNLEEVLHTADANDIDVFGRMIMVGLMGVDDVKGWLHTRGGKL